MHWRPRSPFTLVLAIFITHFVGFGGFAFSEPISDRAFFVRWSGWELHHTLRGVHFVTAQAGWAVGDGGAIVATRDGGVTWALQTSGTGKDLWGVHFADARTGWAVGLGGTIVATRDGGATWAPQTSGTDKYLLGAHFADARTGWAVGQGGTIVATRDSGATWVPQTSGTHTNLRGVHFADVWTGWAVGERGTIVATGDGGITWAPQTSGTHTNLRGVHFADAQTGWAVGLGGTIVATRDGGATWASQTSGTDRNLLGLHFADARTGWAVGRRGTIVATRDGGATWAPQASGTDKDLFSVHFADAWTGWAVGENGTMLRSGPPIYAPSIDDANVAANAHGEVDVSFRVKTDGAEPRALVFARVREANWTSIGVAMKSDPGNQLWHLRWKPESIAHSGDEIEYRVQLDDSGPAFFVSLGKFTYNPLWVQVWHENRVAIISGLTALVILLVYAGGFGFALAVALAQAGSVPGLDSVANQAEMLRFFGTSHAGDSNTSRCPG
jgi:photosystem II stability/assembly factor-like uncharacterized protein